MDPCVQAQVELRGKNLRADISLLLFITLLLSQQACAEEWETVHSLNSLYEGDCEADALCKDAFPQLKISSKEHPLPLFACCRIIESS